MSVVDFILIVLICCFAGIRFANSRLVESMKRITGRKMQDPMKPWDCSFCMTWWISLGVAGSLYYLEQITGIQLAFMLVVCPSLTTIIEFRIL